MLDAPKMDALTRAVASTVGVILPGPVRRWAEQRMLLRHYTAAKTSGPNGAWRPTKKSADQILLRDAAIIRDRARDLERNSPHIAGAVQTITANVVYLGVPPQAQLRRPDGTLDKDRNDLAEEIFGAWAEETGLDELVNLAFRRMFLDGEILLHPVPRLDLARHGLVPMGLEALEADHLDDSQNTVLPGGGEIRRGVEFDASGDLAAYWIRTRHPGDGWGTIASRTVRIPATDIIHAFRRDRPSQTRGVSWLAPIIMEAFDFTQFQSYHRVAAKLMAAYTRYVTTDMPEMGDQDLVNPQLVATGSAPGFGKNFPEYPQPGQTVFLPKGTDIKDQQYNHPGPYYDAFTKVSLKGMSAGTGVPYSVFSGDFSDSSYSADRSAQLASRRYYEVCQQTFGRVALSPIWRQFWRYARVAGMSAGLPERIPCRWQYPGWEWVDPTKDAIAAEKELANCLTTRRRLCERRGVDFDTVLEERKQEEEAMRSAGLLPSQEGKSNAAA